MREHRRYMRWNRSRKCSNVWQTICFAPSRAGRRVLYRRVPGVIEHVGDFAQVREYSRVVQFLAFPRCRTRTDDNERGWCQEVV